MSNFPAGSKVIITNADEGEPYKNGDIFTVDFFDNPGVDVTLPDGTSKYLASREFEAHTEPKKIRVLKSNHPREYVEGDILEVSEARGGFDRQGDVHVTNKHGNSSVVFKGQWEAYTEPAEEPLAEWEKELLDPNYTPRQIEISEIQAGDTIKAEYSQHGVKYATEAVAGRAHMGGWVTEAGLWVAATHYVNATYTLLERPESVNPYAEAKVGSLARRAEGDWTYCKVGDNEWRFVWKGVAKLSDSKRSDENMNNGEFRLFHVVK